MNESLPKVETAIKQVYKQTRSGTIYQVIYVDDQVTLLRSEDTGRNGDSAHRIEKRGHFEDCRDSGWFEHQPDSDIDLTSFEAEDWSDVATIGGQTAENLLEVGFETKLDVRQADDSELLDVDGIGNSGVKNLRKFTR